MSSSLVSVADDLLGRLHECQRLYPQNRDSFFENDRFAKLLISNVELESFLALIRIELTERFGTDSQQHDVFDRIWKDSKYNPDNVFDSYLHSMRGTRAFIMAMFPEIRQSEAASMNVTIHGNVIGSAIGGRDAFVEVAENKEVKLDHNALDDLKNLLKDFTDGRPLQPEQNAALGEINTDLDGLKQSPTVSVSRLQKISESVTKFATEVFSKTTSAVLSETVKRLVFQG